MAIWFSLSRRASRDLLAATLFFLRLTQYLSSCSSGELEEGKCPTGQKLIESMLFPRNFNPKSLMKLKHGKLIGFAKRHQLKGISSFLTQL
jgi:hypothetical protein